MTAFIDKQTYLFYADQVAGATVTATGSWDPPITNVQDRRLQKIARHSDGVANILIVFAQDTSIGGIAVLNTNANYSETTSWAMYSDAAGTIEVSAGNFIMASDSAILPDGPRNIYAIDGDQFTPVRNRTVRSIRLQLVNLSEDIYIGRVFASRVFWSDAGAEMGSMSQAIRDQSVVTRSYDSTPYVSERPKIRETSLTFHALDEQEAVIYSWDKDNTDRQSMYVIEQLVGGSDEVILLPTYRVTDLRGTEIMDAQATYGLAQWGATEQYQKVGGAMLYRKQITVTESR